MRIFILFFVILMVNHLSYSQDILPVGSHPPALEIPHFPNKVYAVIWRNWNIVPLERIAKTIQCSVTDVEKLGYSMGLPPSKNVPENFDKQLYITVVRRNWHLLPYDQLLTLLNRSAEELAMNLKDDDFLYVKLGNLKPQCDEVIYTPPTKLEKKKAKKIRQLVQKYFPAKTTTSVDRLSFIDSLQLTSKNTFSKGNNDAGLRYIYSYFGVFGDPLLNPDLDPYPDGLLEKLASRGVNGVWLHVVLNQLVEEDGIFPEFGKESSTRLKNLRDLVSRTAEHGISVYLYMNEPRAMPVSFFDTHTDIAGVQKGEYMTMCTSTDKVNDWITNSLAYVFDEVPGLGGVFTISASENLTSCASHGLQDKCSRCKQRDYPDIIAGVNKAIEKGVHQSAPDAKVIVWDWGWYNHGDGTEIIKRLPKNIWLMAASEWKTPFERGGVKSSVGEYSISVIGPGPRAQNHWKVAQEYGLKTVAKMQINNTWELSAVPWLPVLDLNAEHLSRLSHAGLDGYMLSWSLGGYPSPNLELAQMFNVEPELTKEEALNRLAEERYGSEGRILARQSWSAFSRAFQQFPYDINTVYKAPQQYGPSNLLYANPTGYTSTMVGLPYDDLDGWRGPYSREIFSRQFEKVADGWQEGLGYFDILLENVADEKKARTISDYGIARAAYLHFRSVANQCRYIMIRDEGLKSKDTDSIGRMKKIIDQEIENAIQLFHLVQKDSRIGFEASNQYYYVSQDLMEKVINCVYLLDQLKN